MIDSMDQETDIESDVEIKEKTPKDISHFFNGMMQIVKKKSYQYSYDTCEAVLSELKFGDYPNDYFNRYRRFKKWH